MNWRVAFLTKKGLIPAGFWTPIKTAAKFLTRILPQQERDAAITELVETTLRRP